MSVFGKIAKLVLPTGSAKAAQHPFLPRVVEALGSNIAAAQDFAARLTPALESATGYFAREMSAIPGSFPLVPQAHGKDPFLTSLFPAADELLAALGRSTEVRESLPGLAARGHQEVHAILGMRCQPGTEVAGVEPVFVDHTLRSLAPTADDVRDYLGLVAFERILKNFQEHVQKLRRQEKNQRRDLHVQNELARNQGLAGPMDAAYEIRELAPDNMLRGLIAWLNAPAEHLQVKPRAITWHVRQGDAPVTYELPSLHSADRRHWYVCIVRFPTQLGLEAISRESRGHRYILI